MEEGDGAVEEAGGEVVRAGVEEPPHFLVLLLWEGLEPELCGLMSKTKSGEKITY